MSPSRRRAIGAVRGRAIPPPRRAHPSCPVAVGRDVPIAPPRHRRGALLGIPRPTPAPHARAPRPRPVPRPVARSSITPAKFPRCNACGAPHPVPAPLRRAPSRDPPLHPRISRAALPLGGHPGRRDGDIAPYRNYTRDNRTLCPRSFAAPRYAILHYTREIPAMHCPWGLPTPGGAMSAAGPPGSRPTAITPTTIARYAHAPRRTPFLSAHAASRCRVLGHNDHSNSRFCLKVRKRLGRSLTFVCGIAAHGNHAKKILPLSDSFAKRHHLCPNPKHRNRAAKQSKDGVSFVRSFCENPPFFPRFIGRYCRFIRLSNAHDECRQRNRRARNPSHGGCLFIGSANQTSNAADDSYFLSDAPIEAFPTSIE